MRAGVASRRLSGGILRRALAGLLCLAAAASVAAAAAAHAHPAHHHDVPAFVAAPAGPPCSGELAHAGAAAQLGAQCRSCQELSQARAALPTASLQLAAVPPRRAADTAARLALVAQRVAAAHPSRAPPRI